MTYLCCDVFLDHYYWWINGCIIIIHNSLQFITCKHMKGQYEEFCGWFKLAYFLNFNHLLKYRTIIPWSPKTDLTTSLTVYLQQACSWWFVRILFCNMMYNWSNATCTEWCIIIWAMMSTEWCSCRIQFVPNDSSASGTNVTIHLLWLDFPHVQAYVRVYVQFPHFGCNFL